MSSSVCLYWPADGTVVASPNPLNTSPAVGSGARFRTAVDDVPPALAADAEDAVVLLDQVPARGWAVVNALAVTQQVFDFVVVDHALVVAGAAGDLLLFSSA
jgi:hypothetical protein